VSTAIIYVTATEGAFWTTWQW